MKTVTKTNWTKEELYTYLFIFCMNADYKETKEELATITSRVSEETYKKMHTEFEGDNDYVSIQKIKETLSDLKYSENEIDMLFNECKVLFLSDGKFEILERNLMLGLKRALK